MANARFFTFKIALGLVHPFWTLLLIDHYNLSPMIVLIVNQMVMPIGMVIGGQVHKN